MKIIAPIVLLGAVLSGCASPTPLHEAAPPERVLAPSYLNPTNGNSAIGLTRDGGFYGSACTMNISIDGRPVAALDPSQRVVIYVPSGPHKIGVRQASICAAGGITYFDAITHAGSIYEIRLSQNGGAPTNMFIFNGERPLPTSTRPPSTR